MRYTEFKNEFIRLPIITGNDIAVFEKDKQIVSNQLRRWREKGLILKLRRGAYILNENDRKINPSKHYIANQLYTPSYISLEYALNFYGLIPERVLDVTSITTKKTTRFKNKLGLFVYQHIKPVAFKGFEATKDETGLNFFIAEPEKAVVDFLYLNLDKIKGYDIDVFESSYRFQNIEDLSQKKIIQFCRLFTSDKLARIIRLFCAFLKREKKLCSEY